MQQQASIPRLSRIKNSDHSFYANRGKTKDYQNVRILTFLPIKKKLYQKTFRENFPMCFLPDT